MAREYISSVTGSGGVRRTVAVLAVTLLVASALAPASIATADESGDRSPVVAAVGNTDGTTAGNDAVANDEFVTIRGYVDDADGDPVVNDTLRLRRVDENGTDGNLTDTNRTDEEGRYALQGQSNRTYELTYRQGGVHPGDGVPAVYAVGQVNASSNRTRNVSLPTASTLNLTVVAENETRVANATVRVTHARNGADATVTGRTDERGRIVVDGHVGVEVAGNVTVAVEAPNASFLDAELTLSVANATDREVVLALNDSDPPTLRYEVGPNPVNVSEPVTFDASNSTDASGIEEATWTIQGQPWDARRLSASFPAPGNYSVELSAVDWAGNENRTTMTVTAIDELAPTAALSVDNATVLTNETVGFDASNASDNHRVAEYHWDFDGDGTAENVTTEPTVTYAYDRNGTYDATVVAVDESGNRANATRQVTVELPPPNAAFSVSDLEPDVGERVTFDASPSTAGANVTDYTWTFEDGLQVPDERVITTRFPDSGTYDVTLTITDGQGRTDERTRTIEVPNRPPAADAGENRSVVAGTDVALDASYSTDPDDDLSIRWNQTRGPAVNLSNVSVVEPTFTAPDVNETTDLRFEVVVSDDHGATDEDTVTITVVPRAEPTVSHVPEQPGVNESVTFRANRTGRYRWDFDGDGTPEAAPDSANVTNATASHAFDAAGEYNVTLFDAANRTVVHAVNVTVGNESDSGSGNESDGSSSSGGSGGSSGTGGSSGSGDTGGSSGASDSGGSSGTSGTGDTGSTGGTGSQSGSTGSGDGQGANDADGQNGTGSNVGPAATSPSPPVTVEPVGNGTDSVLASVGNVTPGASVDVRLPERFGGNDSAFDAVTVVTETASNFSLSVASSSNRPEGTPGPEADAVLSYLDVEKHDVTNAEIASARFYFRVATGALEEAGVQPDSVTLYRYSGGAWEALATTLAGTTNGTHRFEAVSPGFSVFAIGLETGSTSKATNGTTTATTDAGNETTDATTGPTSTTTDGHSTEDVTGTTVESAPGDARDAGSFGTGQNGNGFGGVSGETLSLMLFSAALLAAALWGYLLS